MILASSANQWNISRVRALASMGDSMYLGFISITSGAVLQNLICMNIGKPSGVNSLEGVPMMSPIWGESPSLLDEGMVLCTASMGYWTFPFDYFLSSMRVWGMLWIKTVKAISLYSDALRPRHLFLRPLYRLWQPSWGPETIGVHVWWAWHRGLASVPPGIILAGKYI